MGMIGRFARIFLEWSLSDKFDQVFLPFVQISLFFPGEGEKLPSLSRTLMATWPEIVDMDSEHVRTLTYKMADSLYINH
jgi:hypothetical protein